MSVLTRRHAAPATRLRYQRPQLPPLSAVAPYYAMSEAAHWYSNGGPCHELLVERLEARMANGALALPVGNATLGLMVALPAVTQDASPVRDLIVTPSYTFAAAVAAIRWTGRQPLMVDVDPDHWQLDEHALERALERHGRRVAAVLATSTFGTPAPAATRARWAAACDAAAVPLVVDSAAAFGATFEDGAWLGTQGAAEVFSFHATKPFATGEGGLVTTRSPELRDRMARLVNFGFDGSRTVVEGMGMNAKLSELQCAMSLAALDGFDTVLESRRARAERLRARGLEPFRHDAVPEAVMRFRQGVGRLIRRATDRGVLVVCDPRLARASYRGPFRAALPVEPRLWKDPRGLAHEVGLFLAHEHDDDQEESP